MAEALKTPVDIPRSSGAPAFESEVSPPLRRDRVLIAILVAGFLLRLGMAIGLHQSFAEANPGHLWPGTDEAVYYELGLESARSLEHDGWTAFVNSRPRPEYLNWVHFKYTGLVLFLVGEKPFVLRLLSILFSVAGVALFVRSLGKFLPSRRAYLTFTALLALLPSTMFWSALAIKEGIVSFLIALCCWLLCETWRRPRPWTGLAMVSLACLILGAFRIWAGLACFSAFALALLFLHPGRPRLPILLPILVTIILVMALIPNVQLLFGYHVLGEKGNREMLMYAPSLHVWENVKMLDGASYPAGIKTILAWVLPLPLLPGDGILAILAGIENLLFITTGALAVKGAWRKLAPLEIAWLTAGLLMLLVALTFSSHLGTAYRVKATALPFVAYFAACALSPWLARIRARSTR